MRDEFAVLQDLGLDPFAIAAQLAKSSPVLGQAVDAQASGAFAGTFADPVRAACRASGRTAMTTNAVLCRDVRAGVERPLYG